MARSCSLPPVLLLGNSPWGHDFVILAHSGTQELPKCSLNIHPLSPLKGKEESLSLLQQDDVENYSSSILSFFDGPWVFYPFGDIDFPERKLALLFYEAPAFDLEDPEILSLLESLHQIINNGLRAVRGQGPQESLSVEDQWHNLYQKALRILELGNTLYYFETRISAHAQYALETLSLQDPWTLCLKTFDLYQDFSRGQGAFYAEEFNIQRFVLGVPRGLDIRILLKQLDSLYYSAFPDLKNVLPLHFNWKKFETRSEWVALSQSLFPFGNHE